MPTYQYACTECEHRFEQVQKFTDDSLTECPVCHGRLRKVFNAVGVVFKGSGFYRNDSRSGSGSGGDSSSSGGSSEKSDKPSEKSDKPSEKSDTSSEKTAPAAEKKTSSSGSTSPASAS